VTSGTLTVDHEPRERRWIATLLDRSLCSWREGLLAGLLYVGLAFAVYGLHVARGGFILDDWAYASEYEIYGRDLGLFGFADRLLNDPSALMSAGGRPLGALYVSGVFTLFGDTMELHVALPILLAGALSALLYVVLRSLRIERLHAALMAALVLVFPASDSARFWPAGAVGLLALCLFLGGLAFALAGLRSTGRRAFVLHACAVVLYALSLMQYEIALGGILLSGLLYRTCTTSWRPALRRWAVDVAVVVVALLYLRSTTTRTVAEPGEQLDRLRLIQNQARTLLGQVGVQDGRTVLPPVVVVLLLVLGFLVARRLEDDDPARRHLLRWVGIAVGGAVAIGAGYVAFVGAQDDFYRPLREGIGNRTNSAAMIGYVVLLYALFVVVGLLVALGLARLGAVRSVVAPALAITLLCAGMLGAEWMRVENQHRRAWNAAYAINAQTVAVIREHVTKPAPGSSVYAFGLPGETSELVLAFTADWDLTGAVRWIFRDGTLLGVPSASILPSYSGNTAANSGIACRRASVRPRGYFWHEEDATPYGKTIFVDVPTRDVRVIGTPAECRQAVTDFLGGSG
jgi:hypothetical protein